MKTNQKAQDAIIKARTQLLVSNGFFGCLALHLTLVEVEEEQIPTMAVDGKHMFYCAKFVLSLSEEELKGVVAHEVMHCAWKHFQRMKHRNIVKWNIAGDLAINPDLIKAGFTLPGKPVGINSPPGTKGHLLDPKFEGMSTEEIYARLPDPPVIEIEVCWLPKGADPTGCGGVIMPRGLSPAEQEKLGHDWEAAVQMAINAVTRNAGMLPGYLDRLVKHLKKPKVDWREATRQFIDGNMHKDYSWSKPNRRFAGAGLYLPGFVPDALHHLIMVGDVSGSITDKVMQAYVSEVAGALDDGVADKLTAIYVDTEVRAADEYLPGDVVTCNTKGGGGTDFRPAFDWVRENAPDASCIVYLTDMCPNTWNIPDPEIPTLWAAFCPEQFLDTMKVPFGAICHVDEG